MNIPLPVVPQYETELPLSKKKIKYRPFLVKEEKILLLAVEDESESAMKLAYIQVMNNCTFDKVNLKKLPVADVDYLFIKIREKSIGESVPISLVCKSCNNAFDHQINTSELKVDVIDTEKNKKIADNIIVTMSYPTLETTEGITEQNIAESITDTIAACIEMITIDDKVYVVDEEMSRKEISEWLENLQKSQLETLAQWVEKLPRMSYYKQISCPHCNHKNEILLEGIESFFE